MKKYLLAAAIGLTLVACNKSETAPTAAAFKTAYIDSSKLMEEYTEAKDIDAKYKAKSQEMGRELDAEVARFKAEAKNFQQNAQANGQEWAQRKGAELQKREQQLGYAQQAMIQQLQEESGAELDTLIKSVKKFIQDYGKEKGYDYIFSTSDQAASVVYGKEQYDITKEVLKKLEDDYASRGKSTDKKDVKADAKKELEAIENKKK